VSAVVILGLLAASAVLAALAGAFNRPAEHPVEKSDDKADKPAPAVTAPRPPRAEELYKNGSLIGWTPEDGGSWTIESDMEVGKALAGSGGAVRAFDPPPRFSVILSLNPYQTRVDVVIATTDGPPGSATRWLIRLDRTDKEKGTVAFGKQVGKGPFEPVGDGLSVPSPEELTARNKPPYLELKYERSGGKLAALFQGKPLGSTSDAGLKTTALRLETTGPIRIGAASLEELLEPK
jgi:hypothetical protein